MRYVQAEGEPEYDAEGRLVMLHGLIRDQTDDRQCDARNWSGCPAMMR
jgi:hypothetical protein